MQYLCNNNNKFKKLSLILIVTSYHIKGKIYRQLQSLCEDCVNLQE